MRFANPHVKQKGHVCGSMDEKSSVHSPFDYGWSQKNPLLVNKGKSNQGNERMHP